MPRGPAAQYTDSRGGRATNVISTAFPIPIYPPRAGRCPVPRSQTHPDGEPHPNVLPT